MTLYKKKNLQNRTANFANSEINSQVPTVSLKAELTVLIFSVIDAWSKRPASSNGGLRCARSLIFGMF